MDTVTPHIIRLPVLKFTLNNYRDLSPDRQSSLAHVLGQSCHLTGLDIKVLALPAPGQVILKFNLPNYKIYLPNIKK